MGCCVCVFEAVGLLESKGDGGLNGILRFKMNSHNKIATILIIITIL